MIKKLKFRNTERLTIIEFKDNSIVTAEFQKFYENGNPKSREFYNKMKK